MSYQSWSSKLEGELRSRGVSQREIGRALEFWDEAFGDRREAGMSEEEALTDLGSVEAAATAVMEGLSPLQRGVCGLRKNRERAILVIVLLVVGAIVWVPLAVALAIAALAVYVTLWCLIVAAWAFEATGYLMGASSLVAFALAVSSGNLLAGAYDGGIALAVGGAAVLLTPFAIQLTSILFHTSIRFCRWVAHFFVRVARGSDAAPAHEAPSSFWWSRHADAFRTLLVVGGIICGAGLVLVLVALVACGFAPASIQPLPNFDVPLLGRVGYMVFPRTLG